MEGEEFGFGFEILVRVRRAEKRAGAFPMETTPGAKTQGQTGILILVTWKKARLR